MSDGSSWMTGPLGKFMPLQRGFDLPTTKVEPGKVPVVYSNGIGRYHSKSMAKGPGVVTGRSGTIGNVHYVDGDFWPHNTALWVTDFKHTDPKFVYYFLQHLGLSRFAGGSGVPTLNRNDAHSFIISIPTKREEQKKISAALNDIDQWIAILERQIAKKQAIKQGMMQQLLTGYTRLPGFRREWVDLRAGDLGTFRGGSGFAPQYQGAASGPIPFFKVSDMNNDGNELFMLRANNYVTETQRKSMGAVLMPAEAIVFAKVGAAVFLERKRILTAPSCVDNNMAAYSVDKSRVDVRFMHYFLSAFPLSSLVATGALPSLNGVQLRSIPISLPTDLTEQQAIASILIDADSEIDGLRGLLAKARGLKEGMMQQLLTGLVRLPMEAAS